MKHSAALSNMFQSINMQLFPCMIPAVQGECCKKGVASELLTYIKRGVFFNIFMILEHFLWCDDVVHHLFKQCYIVVSKRN